MRFYLLISCQLLVLLNLCNKSASTEVACEKIKTRHWGWTIENIIITCYMIEDTEIYSNDVSISSPKDSSVKGFLLEHNQNIQYLPVEIYKSFPNLLGLSASDCEIRSISKENFENLNDLTEIHMHGNKIEKVLSNTFEDLTSLKHIFLGQNKIKYMNGEVFLGLPNLNFVSLLDNVCVDVNYHHRIMVDNIVSDLNNKCWFEDPTESKHDPNRTKTSSLKVWTIIIFVALVLAAVGAGVYIKFYHHSGMRYV